MSKKSDTKAAPPKKGARISKADELVKGSDAELDEESLKRVTGGALDASIKLQGQKQG